MPVWMKILIFGGIFLVLFSIQLIARSKKPVRETLFGILEGLGALIFVNVTGLFTSVFLPVSVLSLLVSAVLGIPGVTLMLIFNVFL